jgi:hypothetical protein
MWRGYKIPRCCARARVGTAARCHRAGQPFHRRRRQRPLPRHGVSRSRVFRGANRWKSMTSSGVLHGLHTLRRESLRFANVTREAGRTIGKSGDHDVVTAEKKLYMGCAFGYSSFDARRACSNFERTIQRRRGHLFGQRCKRPLGCLAGWQSRNSIINPRQRVRFADRLIS